MNVFRADPAASADLTAWYRLDVVGNTRGKYIVSSAGAPELENVPQRHVAHLSFFKKLASGRVERGLAFLASTAGQRPPSVRSRDEQDVISAQAEDGGSMLHDMSG